jgi:elongation factor 1 alpha-like protein
VSDILKDSSKGVVVTAVVLQGSVDESQPLFLRPANDRCLVKSIMKDNAPAVYAAAGDSIQLTLADLEESRIGVGSVLCSLVPVHVVGGEEVENIVPLSRKFTARISTFNTLAVPLIKGTQVTLHLGSNIVEANISKLLSLLDSSGIERKVCVLIFASILLLTLLLYECIFLSLCPSFSRVCIEILH